MPWRSMSARRAAWVGRVAVVDLAVGRELAPEPLAQGARPDALPLSRAADEPERLAVERDHAVAVGVVVHAEGALAELWCDVALEQVDGLVVVVVGVEDSVADRTGDGWHRYMV